MTCHLLMPLALAEVDEVRWVVELFTRVAASL
jgi:hypothetical protein